MDNGSARFVQVAIAATVVSVHVLVMAWDVYCSFWLSGSNTVSAVIREWSQRWPVLPLLVGLVLGHLFWSGHHRLP